MMKNTHGYSWRFRLIALLLAFVLMVPLCGAASAAETISAKDVAPVETAAENSSENWGDTDWLVAISNYLDATPELVYSAASDRYFLAFHPNKATQIGWLLQEIGQVRNFDLRLELLESELERAPNGKLNDSNNAYLLRGILTKMFPRKEDEIYTIEPAELAAHARYYRKQPHYQEFFDALEPLTVDPVFSSPYFIMEEFSAEEIDEMYEALFESAKYIWPSAVNSITTRQFLIPIALAPVVEFTSPELPTSATGN